MIESWNDYALRRESERRRKECKRVAVICLAAPCLAYGIVRLIQWLQFGGG